MRALLQRVRCAAVRIDGETVCRINRGLCVFLGIGRGDTDDDATRLAKKTAELRIFADVEGKMNHSLLDEHAECLVVSQFTLYADLRRGRRPYFGSAETPERARRLWRSYAEAIRCLGIHVEEGRFGASMDVELVNDGPVTLWLDTDHACATGSS